MILVLVTGAGGQLGQTIQQIAPNIPNIKFVFRARQELDITELDQIKQEFESEVFDYCINCAAYTNVEMAERNPSKAFEVNEKGVLNLAQICRMNNTVLIHISTDYVFDGSKESGYTTKDKPNPINQYGKSKWEGEKRVQEILDRYFIIRTSWLYSDFGQNFYKTILAKAKAGERICVTDAQTGCPTKARNLALFIMSIISQNSKEYGIHHFTDGKAMTWYDFARQIILQNGLEDSVVVEKDQNYRTFVARPVNSVLIK